MKNYFVNISNVEDLKKQYFTLAKKYHSDITGGSDDIMKEINSEYAGLFKIYKDVHKTTKTNSKEKTYTAKKSTNEIPMDFITIINTLLKLDGIEVELCGRWLWVSGNTRVHKEALKAAGCKWSHNKSMWSWHYPEDSVRRHKPTTIGEIREKYGSISYNANNTENLLLV